jgi:hypothetical protein
LSISELLKQPTKFFLHKSLNKIKNELSKDLDDFLEYLGENAFVDEVQSDFAGIIRPSEMVERKIGFHIRNEKPLSEIDVDYINTKAHEKFQERRDRLNIMSSTVYEKYNDLISSAHKIL